MKIITNPLDIVHPKLKPHVAEINGLASMVHASIHFGVVFEANVNARRKLLDKIGCEDIYLGQIYRLPILCEEFCDYLLERSNSLDYEVNEKEMDIYQMQESRLEDTAMDLFVLSSALHRLVINPLFKILWATEASEFSSIRLAKYLPEYKASTGWHFDKDSESTAVVELTRHPEKTESTLYVYPGIDVGLAKRGEATLFNGRLSLHKTKDVVSQRDILVFWVNNFLRD